MMNRYSHLLLLLLLSFVSQAQVVFSVDGDEVTVAEFKRMYEKSSQDVDYSKKSVDEYLQLYIEYKIKLNQAQQIGLDKDPEVLREIKLYEDKLIQNEFDKEMMNDLLREVETRLQEEICARHVLIDIKRNPSPDDTLYAYNTAMKVRNEYIAGASFNDLSKRYSTDLDTKYSGGDLGCFTALQLSSYDLENEIFTLKKGNISMPIRTRLGYHIVKIEDRRPSNGMVKATQLFAKSNDAQEPELNMLAEDAIFEAYDKLRSGKDFDEVADSFLNTEAVKVSQDKIDWFTVGTYESAFENGIHSIRNKGDFSEPIQSSYGWHIFRLDDKKPLPDFEELEPNLRDKILEDERYFKSKMNFSDQIKHRYKFKKNEENIKLFIDEVARGIGIQGWQIPTIYDLNSEFFTIGDKVYTAKQFVDYVREQHQLDRFYNFDYYYKSFESNHLLDYHKQHLIERDPELKELLKEYRDGIILFNLMEDEIWENAKEPTAQELKAFYNANKSNYKNPDQVIVRVYEIDESDYRTKGKLKRILQKGSGEYAIRKLNRRGDVVNIGEERININDATINGVNLSVIGETTSVKENGKIKYFRSEKIVKGDVKRYDEVRSRVSMDFQRDSEREWLQSIQDDFNIVIHESVVNSLYQ